MRNWLRLNFVLALVLTLAYIFCNMGDLTESERWGKTSESVTIFRDTYGVLHIFGPTDASVIFGNMYARAVDGYLLCCTLTYKSDFMHLRSSGFPEQRIKVFCHKLPVQFRAIIDEMSGNISGEFLIDIGNHGWRIRLLKFDIPGFIDYRCCLSALTESILNGEGARHLF